MKEMAYKWGCWITSKVEVDLVSRRELTILFGHYNAIGES